MAIQTDVVSFAIADLTPVNKALLALFPFLRVDLFSVHIIFEMINKNQQAFPEDRFMLFGK
jgi:hypothetical protein